MGASGVANPQLHKKMLWKIEVYKDNEGEDLFERSEAVTVLDAEAELASMARRLQRKLLEEESVIRDEDEDEPEEEDEDENESVAASRDKVK